MKYPPIQGGVSARCYWIARGLAKRGHQVTVVTNATEVEDDYRIWTSPEDIARLEAEFDNGGRVRVVTTGHFRQSSWYIPYANPYLTKLAALGTEEIRRIDAEVVFSSYFEPYGMSAHLAASWTGIPHVVQHAGSDRTRLMDHPELSLAYREMLRRASLVVTGDLDLSGLGIPLDRFARIRHGHLPDEFSPEGPKLDIDALVRRAAEPGAPGVNNTRPIDRDAVTIGLYGKLGEVKGSYDLIAALARLRKQGKRFNLVTLSNGREKTKFLAAIREAGIDDCTWVLPFIPHWRVPEFIRACTAVCFLERKFPVEIHTPSLPREVMACGTCLILSGEIANKPYCSPGLRDGENVLVVQDPSNIDQLAATLDQVITDPERARAIGMAGIGVYSHKPIDDLGETYEELFARAIKNGASPAKMDLGVAKHTWEEEILSMLRRFMPVSFRGLEARIRASLRGFLESFDLSGASMESAALAFADELLARDEWPSELAPAAVTREVFRFEREQLWLVVDVETKRGEAPFPEHRRPHAEAGVTKDGRRVLGALKPVRSAWVHVEQFAVDVEAAIATLVTGQKITSMPTLAEPALYVFQKRGSLKGRVFRINREARDFLAGCDEKRTVAELVGAGISRDHLYDFVRQLAKEQVIALR
ncbi:glycosyltransferase [Sorangium cellulosum]|nr:glycosyltransferase [Sorangium cellulosum]